VARQVAWAETAWRDLKRIADYIAEDSPGYVAALVQSARTAPALLRAGSRVATVNQDCGDEPGEPARAMRSL
jgi:plasmid stabilization system protein ParE